MTLVELYKIFKDKNLSVSTDTRTIVSGSIFFALRGENFNGNLFAKEALEKGASFCVIDESVDVPIGKCVFVANVLGALQDFARMYRGDLVIPVIAVTGSNGKTTTKELIRNILEKKYRVAFSPNSFNNHVGVPLTLLSIKSNDELCVIEMGDNHEGEITELCEIAKPNFGLITNIGRDHIGLAGGYDANIRAKLELYKYFRVHGGKIFLDEEDELLLKNSEGLETIPYVSGGILEAKDVLVVSIDGKKIETKFVGTYNLQNIRAAYTVGKSFDVSEEDIISTLANFEPKNNRSEKIITDKNTIILDAYNANPTSIELALKSFGEMENSREKKIVILGDMFELGDFAAEEHKKIIDLVQNFHFDQTYFAGEEFFKLGNGAKNFLQTTNDLIEYLRNNKIENSLILIKGSRGMALERLIKENLL